MITSTKILHTDTHTHKKNRLKSTESKLRSLWNWNLALKKNSILHKLKVELYYYVLTFLEVCMLFIP